MRSSDLPPPDWEGRNLLHLSAFAGDLKCLQYLEDMDLNAEALDKRQRTTLHFAAACGRPGSRAIIEYLLARGLDPCQSDVDGWTPLLWAAKAGKTANVQVLLDAGTDRSYQGDQQWIPFTVATHHGNTGAAAILKPHNTPYPEIFQLPQLVLKHPNVRCDGCKMVSHRVLITYLLNEMLILQAHLRLPL